MKTKSNTGKSNRQGQKRAIAVLKLEACIQEWNKGSQKRYRSTGNTSANFHSVGIQSSRQADGDGSR